MGLYTFTVVEIEGRSRTEAILRHFNLLQGFRNSDILKIAALLCFERDQTFSVCRGIMCNVSTNVQPHF